MVKIGIVTVLYNSGAVLADYFQSLNNQSFTDFSLYVVDNKSSDDSLKVAEKLAKEVHFPTCFLPQDENWGVAKGNNIGIKKAIEDGVDFILLSNNDVVLEKDTIENILKGMLSMKASLAVPKIYYWGTDRMISSVGSHFSWIRCATPNIGILQKDKGQFDYNSVVPMASTCFMLIDARIFATVGLMDESYFVYYDDTDFVWRAVHLNKERLVYIHNSIVWHRESYCTGGGLSDFSLYYSYRNRVYFIYKHYTRVQRAISLFLNAINYHMSLKWKLNKKQRGIIKKCIKDGKNLAKGGKNEQ